MPFNGSGGFSRLFSWVADAAAGIDISSSRMDADTNDIATGLTDCITRDGQSLPTNNLPMAGFRHTGVANGVAVTDYATVGQLNAPAVNWAIAGGTGDALTAAYTPAVTALVDGLLCFVRASAANTIVVPTFAPNGLPVHPITTFGGLPLVVGDIVGALHELILRYNLANTRWELLNPSVSIIAPLSVITASLAAAAVTYAKIQNVAALKLLGNPTGGATAPSEIGIGAGLSISGSTLSGVGLIPTIQAFTTGTAATYTTPAGVKWLEVLVVGGSAGGGGGNSAVLSTAGGASSFSTLAAGGGAGSSYNVAGAGGTASGGNSNNVGAPGNPGNGPGLNHNSTGGAGGSSCCGGAGAGSNGNTTGSAATANSGSGGGGGGSTNGSLDGAAGCGGASGGWVRAIITAPAATYTYTVGAGGAGAAGTSINSSAGGGGGAGAAGRIEVIEHY